MRFVSQLMCFPVGTHSQSEAPAGRTDAMGDEQAPEQGLDRFSYGECMPHAGQPIPTLPMGSALPAQPQLMPARLLLPRL